MTTSQTLYILRVTVVALIFGFVSAFIPSQRSIRLQPFAPEKPWGTVENLSHDQTPRRSTIFSIHLFDKLFEEEGPLGKGITVGKVQVALTASDRSSNSIFGLLDDAGRSSDDSSEGLAEMCNEICMALLRKQSDWVSASSDSRWFSENDAGRAESLFNEWSTTEASKFEKEYLPDDKSKSGGPTIVVVSIILEIEGDTTVFDKAGFSIADTQKVLTSIASNVLVDDGEVVNAFEVFWTPGDGNEVLTNRDVVIDFPNLIDL